MTIERAIQAEFRLSGKDSANLRNARVPACLLFDDELKGLSSDRDRALLSIYSWTAKTSARSRLSMFTRIWTRDTWSNVHPIPAELGVGAGIKFQHFASMGPGSKIG
ncbi:hypothetical protein V6582_21105 (plasmid) [Agrobacterium vitis]|uniref:hypothetical protein n=1 Tax=Agrobacterium vitis TaxID=373 RepID=UPI0012E7ADB8|nr:hypothetical protein [Agrobacterium vitis]MVA27379.1 hypothetical protein [Agrobacterium vitis]